MDLLTYINSGGNSYGNGYGRGYCNGRGNDRGSGNGRGNSNGYGEGYGNGYGDGYGNGNSNGCGDGYGYSSGGGIGCDYGNGCGYGNSIIEFEGVKGYYIDCNQTFLNNIRGNLANGFILQNNVKKVPCYVYLTDDGFIAHGDTLHEARESAIAKSMRAKPTEQRLQEFIEAHPNIDNEYGDLFQWHHILTGSCEFGRKQWCETHGLKPTDSITVRQFINETINDYGGDIIHELAKKYRLIGEEEE